MAKIKILLLGRHGKAPQKPEGGSLDELFPETITDLYKRVGVPLQDKVSKYGIVPSRAFLRHTDKKRTRYTGESVLAGAFDMYPDEGTNPPGSQEDLERYDFSAIDIREDSCFNIKLPDFNMKVDTEQGPAANIDYWLKNPSATKHEGEDIETYASVSARVKDGARKGLDELLYQKDENDEKDFGIIVTHVGLIETALIELINSDRQTPIKKVEEIGGPLGMGEFAELVIEKEGRVYKPTLCLKGEEYSIDLNRLYYA